MGIISFPSLLVRPVEEKDLKPLSDIAKKVGAGITTLPSDEKIIKKKIQRSLDSFAQNIPEPSRLFLFVLEDLSLGELAGTSAIEAQVAYLWPYYSYYVTELIQKYQSSISTKEPIIVQKNKILYLSNDYQESSLLCTLYVEPKHRALGQGSLMSRIRYLFIAEFPDFFADRFIAEMRGVFDENMRFPFWNGLGQLFYDMELMEAEKILSMEGTRIVTDLNPRLPIYIDLLPMSAQRAVGAVHKETEPALHVLLKEGFTYQNHIDVFDGGPIVEARKKDLHTAKISQRVVLSGFTTFEAHEEKNKPRYIVCNTSLDFRATITLVEWCGEKEIRLEKNVAEILQVAIGDNLRLCAFR